MKFYIIIISILFSAYAIANEEDRLDQLAETLANGSFSHPDNIEFPPVSNASIKLRDKTIELSAEEIEEKFRAIAKRYVNTSSLNVRDKPNGLVIDKLARGHSVFVYDVSGVWERISKESESQQWVDSRLLCSSDGCYKITSSTPNHMLSTYTPSKSTYTPKKKVISSIGGCSCGTGNYCYGPRGGRYCYTSGGNKAYR